MSNVHIKRAVENIRHGTNIYTPIIEVVVNAIQAIEAVHQKDGVVKIFVDRSKQSELEGKPEIAGFKVADNGVGFTDQNKESFDTLFSDNKASIGGKGFGRFTCLKYFDDVQIESVYSSDESFFSRSFKMGKGKEIIVDEINVPTVKTTTGTEIQIRGIKQGKFPEKGIETIARTLVEKLLPYFITEDYECPKIKISEIDGSNEIILNDYIENPKFKKITEIPLANGSFSIGEGAAKQDFTVRLFKFYSPRNQKSKISLVAHKREVTETSIHTFIPEFADDFYETTGAEIEKNYIVKAYVFGKYLDDNVSLERGTFSFPKDSNMFHSIGQEEIEEIAAHIASGALGTEVKARQERKLARIAEYVELEAPWHRDILPSADLSLMPMQPTQEDMEERLQRIKFETEFSARKEVKAILEGTTVDNLAIEIPKLVEKITKTSQNDLIHYVAMRKCVLALFKKSLELNERGDYETEGDVHDIIFPRKGDTNSTKFNEHNLWILDERLNFAKFVSSDQYINPSDRTDLLVYNNRVLFRGENEASNPVTIFEFKRPGREDFVNPSSKEDPIAQITRYTNAIRAGKYKTPAGRPISVTSATPFYGYIVCDLTEKVRDWLFSEKGFKPMPDNLGYFHWNDNINLYMEVLSWDKILKDSEMRNGIFFHKLGIQ